MAVVEWLGCRTDDGFIRYSSKSSNKKHKNIKKKASPHKDKRLTTMTEEEETLTRNDESKMGLVDKEWEANEGDQC